MKYFRKMEDRDRANSNIEEIRQNEQLPQLYSKSVIYAFSIIFSTLFGTILLMSNLKQIGNSKARLEVLIFGVIFTVGSILSLKTIEMQANFGLPLNIIGGLILNEFFWNRYIGKETEFEKKSWHKPAILSAVICIPFVIAMLYAA